MIPIISCFEAARWIIYCLVIKMMRLCHSSDRLYQSPFVVIRLCLKSHQRPDNELVMKFSSSCMSICVHAFGGRNLSLFNLVYLIQDFTYRRCRHSFRTVTSYYLIFNMQRLFFNSFFL